MAREKTLDNKVLDFLDKIGSWKIKYWAGAKFTKSGVPDILACIDGCFFGIEDKAEKGKPSLLQIVNLKKIREAGGIGILLYPNEFENFKRFINEFLIYEDLTYWQKRWYSKNIELQYEWKKKLENF